MMKKTLSLLLITFIALFSINMPVFADSAQIPWYKITATASSTRGAFNETVSHISDGSTAYANYWASLTSNVG